jgi:hypothetical protein
MRRSTWFGLTSPDIYSDTGRCSISSRIARIEEEERAALLRDDGA